MATFTTGVATYTWELKLPPGDGWVSLFPSKKLVVSKPIPFAFVTGSSEITQFLGQNNPQEKFTVLGHDDATAPTIEAAWKLMLPGTLDLTTEFGTGFVFNGVYLTDVSAKRRRPWDPEWEVDVVFTQYATT